MEPSADKDAQFLAWIRNFRAIYWKIARSFADIPADQDDLSQEMQVQLWRSRSSFRGGSKPSTWVYRVCLNTAIRWRRSATRRKVEMSGSLEEVDQYPTSESDPGRDAAKFDLITKLYSAIRELPEAARTVMVLHLDDLSYEEIAEITGMTKNHIGVTLSRARVQLSKTLKEVSDEL